MPRLNMQGAWSNCKTMHKVHSVQFSATEFIHACCHYDLIELTELVGGLTAAAAGGMAALLWPGGAGGITGAPGALLAPPRPRDA